ncbi:MAG TPA: glycosyltransferase family 2 protein [Verrucomicrobiae bacterium]|nr:glycosyltransferase family 2 protein [Verrucomicrobiae bacterium]
MSSVAICIPTYNQSSYLERAVLSALAQSVPCEVWVSDDASSDDTPEVMRRLLSEHSRIKHIRHKQNLGLPGNPRWLVQQPLTEFVLRLDSDDELCPNYVHKVLSSMLAHQSAGYGHVAVREIDGNGRDRKLRLLARSDGFHNGDESLRASVTGYRVAANICLFRRVALQEVNYYRIAAQYCDDWDLAVRLADAGWGNVYINEVLAKYRVWDTSDNVRSRRKLSEIEGCCRVIEDSLIPAFTRRDWSLAPIHKLRRKLAVGHAVCLRLNHFTKPEQNDLTRALCKLGDSLALRWKFRWIRTPMACLFQLPTTLLAYAKARYKTALFRKHQ